MQTATLAILGLATLFVGLVLRLTLPGLGASTWGVLAVGAGLLVVAVVLDFRRVRGALASRRGRFGVGTTVKVSLFAGIVLLVNAISVGTYHRFDLSGLAQFTLTSQTKEVLAKLDKPVEAVNFFTPSISVTIASYARDLLAEYQNYTDRLTVRDVDPDLNPEEARQYQVDQIGASYGVTVFRSAEGERQVYGPQISAEAEHAFTSAILEVTGTRQKKVYFLTGHGESGIHSDYDVARSSLRDNLYQVDELDLLRTAGVPGDAAVLVVAGPEQPLAGSELEILRRYLENGGRMLLLLNPGAPQGLRRLIGEWDLAFRDGVVIDPASYVAPNEDVPLVAESRNRFGLAQLYFPGAAAVAPQPEIPANLELVPLAWTSPESWLAVTPVTGGKPKFDPRTDQKGPLAIGALISDSNGMRLAVIADSDFAANGHFRNGGNGDLFLSAMSWLAEGKDIVSVDRKVLPARRLILTPEEARFLSISSIVLLPLALAAVGGWLAWRRR